MADQDAKQAAISAFFASGFPFQTAIVELVRQVPHCKLLVEEWPWRDDTGAGFVDLIVCKHNFIVAIECKKTQKEIFTFLQTTDNVENAVHSRCLYLTQIQDSTMRMELYCADWRLEPSSRESMFCVVSTSDSGKDQRMLEKDAQLLIRGADAFGRHIKQTLQPRPGDEPNRVFIPIIVTNAKLFEAKYDPRNISPETGQLQSSPDISPIEWIRFRKAFTAGGANCDRTVLVVCASSLQKFLLDLDWIYPFPKAPGIHVS